MQPIPTAIAALLPLLATILSSWLNDDKFKPGVNALIAAVFVLLTAVGCELLSASIPVSWTLRLVGVLVYVGVLMAGDLSVLYQYLVYKPSPLSSALGGPTAPTSTQTVTTSAVPASVPTPITLPVGSTPVPQRASAQPPTTPSA
jgi:hypothetical protein